jgi:hypothetical protein
MGAASTRAGLAVAVAAVVLLSCQTGTVHAHPHLVGRWASPTPPGGLMEIHFGPGAYIDNMVWRGPCLIVVSGCVAGYGEYELRMFSGTQGTIGIKSGPYLIGTRVGLVDFAAPQVDFLGVIYKR